MQHRDYLDVGEKLGEPLVLLADLESQLSGVTHHQHRNLNMFRYNTLINTVSHTQSYLSIHWLDLLESSQNKYSSFSHTRLGLAQNVHTQDGLEKENSKILCCEVKSESHYGINKITWGMHSCWTSLGCSNPQSTMALRISGLSRKSLKPLLWMET